MDRLPFGYSFFIFAGTTFLKKIQVLTCSEFINNDYLCTMIYYLISIAYG